MYNLKINNGGNIKEFIKMLAWIEFCGNIGHTPKYLSTYIDGDGNTRWKFDFDDYELKDLYEETKNKILSEWNKNGKDLEYVEI